MLITMNYYCPQRDPRRDRKVPTEKYTRVQMYNTCTYIYAYTYDVLLPISSDILLCAVRWIRLILEVIYRFLVFAGDNLKVCQSRKSCCNAATEARLIDMVDSEYKRHLAAQAGYVYDLLNSTAHHLQGKQKTK